METHTHTHTHTHARTHARTHAHIHTHTHGCSRNWVLILDGAEILWEEEGFQFGFKRWQGWAVANRLLLFPCNNSSFLERPFAWLHDVLSSATAFSQRLVHSISPMNIYIILSLLGKAEALFNICKFVSCFSLDNLICSCGIPELCYVFMFNNSYFVRCSTNREGMPILGPIFSLATFCYLMVRVRDRRSQTVLCTIVKRFAQTIVKRLAQK